jgi:dipeptidase E
MPQTRVLLGGGGSADDERPIYERFAAWVGTGSVLYLPIASKQPGAEHLAWVTSVLQPMGVGEIDMWTELAGRDPGALNSYAGVFIGGGNTYWLLHQIRTAGFVQPLRRFAQRGGIIYGGSAGAILLGADIATCAHMDDNFVGLTDTRGLDLAHGRAVWCHYTPADWPLCSDFVRRTGIATLLLAETSGLWVRGPANYQPVGLEAVPEITAGAL